MGLPKPPSPSRSFANKPIRPSFFTPAARQQSGSRIFGFGQKISPRLRVLKSDAEFLKSQGMEESYWNLIGSALNCAPKKENLGEIISNEKAELFKNLDEMDQHLKKQSMKECICSLPEMNNDFMKPTMIKEIPATDQVTPVSGMAAPSSAPHQMQVRVTFYTSHNPQSVLMILKNDQALQQITDKARELFPSADYRLFYGDVNGPIYEFTDSDQVMSKIRITTFSRTPQLFVRLESGSACSSTKKSSKGERESKNSSSLKRIEQNQDATLKQIENIGKQLERVSVLETMVAELHANGQKQEPVKRPFPPVKHSASCDACLGDIIGHRYKCLECADYDLCEKCEKKSVHYEHAMIRLVHPQKTVIPSYVATSSPNIFPAYMRQAGADPKYHETRMRIAEHLNDLHKNRTRVLNPTQAPTSTPIPAAAPAPTPAAAPEARFFNEETCAALINSASVLKDTFSTLSKSFMDLADGAQAGMDKKIIERSTMEAGVNKLEERMENLKRQYEEKCFGSQAPESEKTEEVTKKNTDTSSGHKIKKAKKKSVYKKSSEKLIALSLAAAAEQSRLEAKQRADASTAELQRKLAELNVKENQPKTEETRPEPASLHYEQYSSSSLEALMKAILGPSDSKPPTTPTAEPTAPVASAPVASAPVISDPVTPTAPIVETLIVPPLPVFEPKPEEVVPKTTTPISIHSSFENISSDFENLSPSWGYQVMDLPQRQQEVDADDDLLEFSDVVETLEENRSEPQEPEPSIAPFNSEEEKIFDRLLEMGFDYNVVVSAIRANGADLEKCLLSLLQ